ncbi:hypothetical protein ACS0TY_024080 [Phlomoides rotata]
MNHQLMSSSTSGIPNKKKGMTLVDEVDVDEGDSTKRGRMIVETQITDFTLMAEDADEQPHRTQ